MKKLSELNSVELATVLCKIAEPAANIFSDPAVGKFFSDGVALKEDAASPMAYFTKLLALGAPVILGDEHRDDVFMILAALKGVDINTIREQPGTQTVREVIDILTKDMDMLTFFRNSPKG